MPQDSHSVNQTLHIVETDQGADADEFGRLTRLLRAGAKAVRVAAHGAQRTINKVK